MTPRYMPGVYSESPDHIASEHGVWPLCSVSASSLGVRTTRTRSYLCKRCLLKLKQQRPDDWSQWLAAGQKEPTVA
jgi:hypothetical protein